MFPATEDEITRLRGLVVVSHHPIYIVGGVVASLRAVATDLGIDWRWIPAQSPSPVAADAEVVLFNGGFSLDSDGACDLLADRLRRGARCVVYWHEMGFALRRLQGLAAPGDVVDRRRARRWTNLGPLLSHPSICHLAASTATKVAVAAVSGADPRRIAVVYEGVSRNAPSRTRPHPTGELRICSAGVNDPRKNGQGFADLARILEVGSMRTRWTWYGDNDAVLSSPDVHTPGVRMPLVDALAAHDVYVALSVDEPFSVSALEALRVGLPVVCLEATGLAEMLPSEWVVHCEREVPAVLASLLLQGWPGTETVQTIADRFTPALLAARIARAIAHCDIQNLSTMDAVSSIERVSASNDPSTSVTDADSE